MKFTAVNIYDEKAKVNFSFIKQFPGICAQGKSIEENKRKMEVYFEKYLEKIQEEKPQIEFEQDLQY